MEAKAKANYVRIAPRKARAIVDLIRNKPVDDARAILIYNPRKAAGIVKKLLDSAVANAQNNQEMDPDALYVHRVFVDEGPTMKRVQPRARGRRNLIRKRMSHITLVLREGKEAT